MSIPYLFVKKIIKIESCNLTIFSFIVLICRSGWPVGSKLCFLFSAQEKRDLPNGWLKIWSKNKICHTFWECDFFILYDVKFMWNYLKKKKKTSHMWNELFLTLLLSLSRSLFSHRSLSSLPSTHGLVLLLLFSLFGAQCHFANAKWIERLVGLEKL